MLTKDDILNADDMQIQTVAVPEWGGNVCVRVMTGVARGQFESQFVGGEINPNVRIELCALTLCDEAGNLLFTKDEIGLLEQKSSIGLVRVFNVAWKLNALDEEGLEEMEGN